MAKTGVSQKAIVFNKEKKFLTLRRSRTAPSDPDSWDLPGGDLDFGEDPLQGIKREIKEETGLSTEKLALFDINSLVNKKGEFWVTIAYKTYSVSERVTLSFEHDDFKWVFPEEFLKLKSSPKLRGFVKKLTG